MTIHLTWASFLTAVAVVGGVVTLTAYFVKLVLWFSKQNQQDKKIEELSKHHDDDMNAIKEEMSLVVSGVQACLKGLQSQGCAEPVVAKTSEEIEKYLNEQAHKRKE